MKSKDNESSKNVRKFTWKERRRFSTYDEASNFKNSLLDEGFKHIKIRRCGPDGIKFKVTVGTPVKTNKKDNNKSNKKENNNAN